MNINHAESIVARALAQAYYAGKRHGLECMTGEDPAPLDEILVEDCATWFIPRAQRICDDIAEQSEPVESSSEIVHLPVMNAMDAEADADLPFDRVDTEAQR